MYRRPQHGTPLVGAATALALTSLIGGVLAAVLAREGLGAGALVPLALPLVGGAFAAGLFWFDGALLRWAGYERPAPYARLWRRVWLVVPLCLALGAVAGALMELEG